MPFRTPLPADEEGSDWTHVGSESYYEVSLSTSSGVTILAPGSTCEVQVSVAFHSWEVWLQTSTGNTEQRDATVQPAATSLSLGVSGGGSLSSYNLSTDSTGLASVSLTMGTQDVAVTATTYGDSVPAASGTLNLTPLVSAETWTYNHSESFIALSLRSSGGSTALTPNATDLVIAHAELSSWDVYESDRGNTRNESYSSSAAVGALVDWSLVSGNGSISADAFSYTTDSNGDVTTTFTMGDQASEVHAQVSYGGSQTATSSLVYAPSTEEETWAYDHTETAITDVTLVSNVATNTLAPGAQATLTATACTTTCDIWISNLGNQQSLNVYSVPADGASLQFVVESGDGVLATTQTTSDSNGSASVLFGMGSSISRVRVDASLSYAASASTTLTLGLQEEVWQYTGTTSEIGLTLDAPGGTSGLTAGALSTVTFQTTNTISEVWTSNGGQTAYLNPITSLAPSVSVYFAYAGENWTLNSNTNGTGSTDISIVEGDSTLTASADGAFFTAHLDFQSPVEHWQTIRTEGTLATTVTTDASTTELQPGTTRTLTAHLVYTSWDVCESDWGNTKCINENVGPAINAPVVFTVESGDGTLAEVVSSTDASGNATAFFTLGTQSSCVRVNASFSGASSEGSLDLDRAELTYLSHEKELVLKLGRKSNDEDATLEAVFHEWDVYSDANGALVEKNDSSGPASGAFVTFEMENPKGPLSDPETHTNFEGKASTYYQVWISETLTATVHFQDLVETISLVVQSDGSWSEKSELKTSLSLSGDTLAASVTYETWMERFNTRLKATQISNFVSQPAAYANLNWSVETGNATLLTADATADEYGTGTAKLKLGSDVSSIRASGQYNNKISPPSAAVPVPARDPADVQQPIIQCRWAKASTHGGHHDYFQGAWVYQEGHIGGVGTTGADSDWELCPGFGDSTSGAATRLTAPVDYRGWIRENWPLETVGFSMNSDGIASDTVSSPAAARLSLDVSELDWLDGLTETTVTSTTFVGAYGMGSDPVYNGKPNYTPASTADSVVIIGSQSGIKADFTGGTLEVRTARPQNGDSTDPLKTTFWITTINTTPEGVTTTSTTTDDLVILAGAPYSTRNILLAANVTVNGSAITKIIGTVPPPNPTVKIEPDTGMTGVIGDIVKSTKSDSKIRHFVTPKESGQFVMLKATGISEKQIKDGDPDQIYEWDKLVGQAVPNEPLKWKVSRDTAANQEVKIKRKSDGTVASQMDVWVVWAEATVKTVGPVTDQKMNPSLGMNLAVKANFEYSINPNEILDTSSDVPDFTGSPANPPGEVANSCGDLLRNGIREMWDATRSIEVTSTGDSCQDKTRTFPKEPLEGNDDVTYTDELLQPYTSKKLSQYDNPSRVVISGMADNYECKLRFYEFARLDIGGKWFLISTKNAWRVHYKMKRIDGLWKDQNSVSDQLDQPFQ